MESRSGREAGRGAVLALAADLIFASRIRGAGRAQGVEVRTVSGAQALESAARESRPALIIVDLEARGANWAEVIERLKSEEATSSIPVVAFAPHVHEAKLAAARAAGAERVLSRSAFVRALPDLMREAAGGGGAEG